MVRMKGHFTVLFTGHTTYFCISIACVTNMLLRSSLCFIAAQKGVDLYVAGHIRQHSKGTANYNFRPMEKSASPQEFPPRRQLFR